MPAQFILQQKESRIAGTSTLPTGPCEMSLWQFDGQPSGGAVPSTSWTNPDNTYAGSLMQASPAAGLQQWLHAIELQCQTITSIRGALYDRLAQVSGLSGTVTTAQNVNGGSAGTLSRYSPNWTGLGGNTTGVGNEIFLEIYTAIGTTPTTVTAIYTNTAGVATQQTQAVTIGSTTTSKQGHVIRLPLAAGDTGVQAVTSVTLAASTGTAGNFGVVVAHRLTDLISVAGQPTLFAPTFTSGGPINIMATACLAWCLTMEITLTATDVPMIAIFTLVDN